MSGPKPSILIVDDEPVTRTLLSQVLTHLSHTVTTAQDGFSALKHLRSSVPDIVLSDLNMPGMSGFELLSVINRRFPGVFVIASSGAYTGSAVPDGIAADAFYEKATNLQDLLDLIARAGNAARPRPAELPFWISLEDQQLSGSSEILISCPDCLRNFPHNHVPVPGLVQTAACVYCDAVIRYAIVTFLGRVSERAYHTKLGSVRTPHRRPADPNAS